MQGERPIRSQADHLSTDQRLDQRTLAQPTPRRDLALLPRAFVAVQIARRAGADARTTDRRLLGHDAPLLLNEILRLKFKLSRLHSVSIFLCAENCRPSVMRNRISAR
jgi:hypothetical protein